jgi:hypothetical protein
VALVVSLFLPWYKTGSSELTGWEAFTVVDIFMTFAAFLAIAAAAVTAARRTAAVSVAASALTIVPALTVAVIAAWRLIDPAPNGDVTREVGAWLGFAAATGIALGGAFGMRDEGPDRRTRRAAAEAGERAQRQAELLSLPGNTGNRA